MPNGKSGDHPYTDILLHGRDVYSPHAAGLVREIARLADEGTRKKLRDLLWNEFNDFQNPDVEKLESLLTEWRDKLIRGSRQNGSVSMDDGP